MLDSTLDDDGVRTIYRKINNWARWGTEDQLGTLNFISPSQRKAAAKLIVDGISIGCGRPLDTTPSPMNSIPAQHFMVAAGDVAPERGVGVSYDQIGVFPHGQAQSHLDALCHISDSRRLFNDRPASLVTSTGAKTCDITVAGNGIVSRGVLLDIPAVRGTEFLQPDAPVRPSDLERAEAEAGVRLGEGDILIYRTGRHERRASLGPQCERLPDGRGHLPGIYPDCLEWIHERKIALIGSDCAHDILPSPFAAERFPIHVGTEVYMGLLLLHNLQLEALKDACAMRQRYEFFFSISPLRIAGGTASPVNPLAIF